VLFELQQAVDGYHFAHRQMQECDQKLERYLAQMPTRILEAPAQPEDVAVDPKKKKKKEARKPRGNEPRLDMKAELKRICGVDLTSIDGISAMTAQTILAEVGTDMSGFKNEHHFSSWLGLTPSKDISGGKTVRRGKKKVKNRLTGALRMAATSLLGSDSYLGARYRYLRRRLPTHKSAVKAMAHYLARLVYRMLTKGEAWVDRGAAQFEKRRSARELASLTAMARANGFQLIPLA
jgi:transposase